MHEAPLPVCPYLSKAVPLGPVAQSTSTFGLSSTHVGFLLLSCASRNFIAPPIPQPPSRHPHRKSRKPIEALDLPTHQPLNSYYLSCFPSDPPPHVKLQDEPDFST
ncbi:hypothetical protein KFK09_003929 [Dendrobium nobile]|uniref:Uncharacterized protein n=1 Tax=Dendrobium nobile TaxID=94219 RepID=A0A8T3C3Y5_DENNO|nr:hypothetical protein KFK09_003929 [Dendrobium nobile]